MTLQKDPKPAPLLRRGTRHVETMMGDQVVAMSLEQGKYFALTGTARRVWELIDPPITLDDLVAKLSDEFDVQPDQCLADLQPFLKDMKASGLIEEAEA